MEMTKACNIDAMMMDINFDSLNSVLIDLA